MADEFPDNSAVLSDLEDDDDDDDSTTPTPPPPPTSSSDHRIADLLSQLDHERRHRLAAEQTLSQRDDSLSRLKAFAQDLIKKRDDALRDKEDALKLTSDLTKARDHALKLNSDLVKTRDDAIREKDEILNQKDSLKSEIQTAAQMMVTGIEKISGKISNFKNFAGTGLPRSQKYATGLPAVAYGVIKRANEIVEEMLKQIDGVSKSRDQAREQIEQRNYEIAIEVSQLEATIAGLREEVDRKGGEVGRLGKQVSERDVRISEMDKEVLELREVGEERDGRLRSLEAKVDSQRPEVINQLRNVVKTRELVREIVRVADWGRVGEELAASDDFSFVGEEIDMDENWRGLTDGTVGVYEMAKVAVEKVRRGIEERRREIDRLREKVNGLVAEKQHIGVLLRSVLESKTSEVMQVAENGLREAGIDLRFNGQGKSGANEGEEDEVYTLAGALENTVKASQLEIIELKHLVEALKAESSLLNAHLDAQAKEITQQKHQIKELKEKENLANENVEGLMLDITAAEEEIARWKAAAEQEAAAGTGVEQEFLSQMSALRQELDETKQAMLELENKLRFKEETAAAAMAARDAAENSLRLADLRSTRLRERVEELSRQVEVFDNRIVSRNGQNNHRYVCWPWQWLGLNSVRYQTVVEDNSNEMELSEPLI